MPLGRCQSILGNMLVGCAPTREAAAAVQAIDNCGLASGSRLLQLGVGNESMAGSAAEDQRMLSAQHCGFQKTSVDDGMIQTTDLW